MNTKIVLIVLVLVLVGTLGWMVNQRTNAVEHSMEKNGKLVTLYKSPFCGCCEKWGTYMEREGYTVAVTETEEMQAIKERFKVPYELESCHTAEIEGYVVEGHVPDEAVEKLLTEKPDIKGIGMAGMPSGSPGMPGIKEDFLIYEINHDGTKGSLFMSL